MDGGDKIMESLKHERGQKKRRLTSIGKIVTSMIREPRCRRALSIRVQEMCELLKEIQDQSKTIAAKSGDTEQEYDPGQENLQVIEKAKEFLLKHEDDAEMIPSNEPPWTNDEYAYVEAKLIEQTQELKELIKIQGRRATIKRQRTDLEECLETYRKATSFRDSKLRSSSVTRRAKVHALEADQIIDEAEEYLEAQTSQLLLCSSDAKDKHVTKGKGEGIGLGKVSTMATQAQNSQVDNPKDLTSDWIKDLSLSKPENVGQVGTHTLASGYSTPLRVSLKEFSGDPSEWNDFISMFKALVHQTGKSPEEKLCLLKMSLRGEPALLLKNVSGGLAMYIKALDLLRSRYGDPKLQKLLHLNKIRAIKRVKAGDPKSLDRFAIEVQGLLAGLDIGPSEAEHLLSELEEKLPLSEKIQWRRAQRMEGKSINAFGEWVGELALDARSFNNLEVEEPHCSKGLSERDRLRSTQTYATGWKARKSDNQSSDCPGCSDQWHPLYQCEEFKQMSAEEKINLVRASNLCFKCLGSGHHARGCSRNFPCREEECQERGHYLLHAHLTQVINDEVKGQEELKMISHATRARDGAIMSLGMMKGEMVAANGKIMRVNILVDNCSNTTLITEKFRKKAGLKKRGVQKATISGSGGQVMETNTGRVSFRLTTPFGTKGNVLVDAWTIDRITQECCNARWGVVKDRYNHLRDLPLQDAEGEPDILIGQDQVDFQKPLETRNGYAGEPYAVKTILGWIARGPCDLNPREKSVTIELHLTQVIQESDAHRLFLDGEAFGTESDGAQKSSAKDMNIIQFIKDNMIKKEKGIGYVATLPWKRDAPTLNSNLSMAEARLRATLRKCSRDPKYEEDYEKGIERYLSEGFAKIIYEYDDTTAPMPDDRRLELGQYFLPHHGVYKNDKQEKLRIVFDSSAKVDGVSLNDCLEAGPKLQNELPHVLIRFREGLVGYIADIKDMFLQVGLNTEDAKKHRFLWKGNNKRIAVLQMNSLTFGDGPSPCVAMLALQKTVEDHGTEDTEVIDTIEKGFYVDDLADSTRTLEEANRKAKLISEVVSHGGFKLTKWLSNDKQFQLMDPNHIGEASVLGLLWDAQDDSLSINVGDKHQECQSKLTKRTLLTIVSSVYSPLGLASPFIIKGKIRLAKLHLLGMGWDDSLQDVKETKENTEFVRLIREEVMWWRAWIKSIPIIRQVRFPRCLEPHLGPVETRQLHCFGDASEEAFAAAVYLRSRYLNGEVTVSLVMAKTRVAPKKTLSVAKLELQAALLGARLCSFVQRGLRMEVHQRIFWTDSTCTRHWVRQTASFYKPFVSNRVGEIQTLTDPSEWRHLPGHLNVADEATRSSLSEDSLISANWVGGPPFLKEPEERWPKDLPPVQIREEIRAKWDFTAFITLAQEEEPWFNLNRYSSWWRARRVCAWALRFVNNIRIIAVKGANRSPKDINSNISGPLTGAEIEEATILIVRESQKQSYGPEIQDIKTTGLRKSAPLAQFTPFVDKNGVLRVGGRVGKSELPYDACHPAIISSKSQLARLIVESKHRESLHSGTEYTLAQVRGEFWIPKGRELVKKVRRKCPTCLRTSVKPLTQKMADLPRERLVPCPPFYRTSIDYFGPMEVKVSRNKTEKRYGCLFGCMVTRAVHLELAQSQSTADFLNAFRMFCNLRGTPSYVYSDNGTNFRGAENEMRVALRSMIADPTLQEEMLKERITWQFQPPAAPHFGGIHESLVKSAKRALYKAMTEAQRRRNLWESELRTLLSEVMGFLNSRPLTYVGSDPKDLNALTPNHFLLQRANPSVPPGVKVDLNKVNPRDNYQFVQSIVEIVWKTWQANYLPTLLTRAKWKSVERNLQENDVVMIVDPLVSRGDWRWGYVTEVFVGLDGLVRKAKVKTQKGEFLRPITKLCLLESNNPDSVGPVLDGSTGGEDVREK